MTGAIDIAMAERSFAGLQIFSEFALHPFEIPEPLAVGEFIEHPHGNQIGFGGDRILAIAGEQCGQI